MKLSHNLLFIDYFTDADYSLPKEIYLNAGETVVKILVRTYHDTVFEENESFDVYAYPPSQPTDSIRCMTTVDILDDSKLHKNPTYLDLIFL